MLLDGINHIAIISNDVEKLGAFYRTVLDADVGPSDGTVNDFGTVLSMFFSGPDGLEGEVLTSKG